jgi:adenylate cyclase class 2
MASMQQLEIEVKFYISALSGIRQQIHEMGGISSGRALEANTRYDDQFNSLLKRGALLRLRKTAGENILTYKSIPQNADRRFKVFNESEIAVSDFVITGQILNSLGFQAKQVYEKWRESFAFKGDHLCLDEMPFGAFLEIEGDPKSIQSIAARLGLDWDERILMTYLEIFSQLKERLDLPFTDVTFDNFEYYQIDASTVAMELNNLFSAS